ncbi:hypothetical protein Hanom_Chr04g00298271 [Helianthus anomalus]
MIFVKPAKAPLIDETSYSIEDKATDVKSVIGSPDNVKLDCVNDTNTSSSCAYSVKIEDWTDEDDEQCFDASFNFSKDNFSMFDIMKLTLHNASENLSACGNFRSLNSNSASIIESDLSEGSSTSYSKPKFSEHDEINVVINDLSEASGTSFNEPKSSKQVGRNVVKMCCRRHQIQS